MEVVDLKPMTNEEWIAFEAEMIKVEREQRSRVYDLESHKEVQR